MNLLLLKLNLQYFAEADNGGSEGEQEQQQEQQEQQEQKEEKTFTQKDVNNIVKKQTASEIEKVLKAAGLTDFENAKDGLAKFKEWQDAQKTDAEKQAEALAQYQKDLEATKAEKETLAAQLNALKHGANAESLSDVIALAKTRVTEELDMESAIKQVLEQYPHFKGTKEQGEQKLPLFSTGEHKTGGQTNDDPFTSKLKKYL